MPRPVIVLALLPACLDPNINLETSASSTSSTSDASTSTRESSSTSDDTTSSSESSSSTGTPPPCDDDPACGPGEDVFNCPAQCNTCGDSVVVAPEVCDNGLNQDPPYSPTAPDPDACAPGCLAVEFCGDSIQNGPEPCDAAGMQTADCELDCRTPTCGDGTLNTLAGEACDDSNLLPGDGCSADCRPERHVFVTSAAYEGDLNAADDNPDMLAGIPLADARCNTAAAAAALPGTYKAWLSDASSSPAQRFDTRFSGLYRLLSPGFPVVAIGWQDLADGSLAHPIDSDEVGLSSESDLVWTNTLPDGFPSSDLHCNNWSSKLLMDSASVGESSKADAFWTDAASGFSCADSRRIYCFENP